MSQRMSERASACISSGAIYPDVPPFIVATHNPVAYGGINRKILEDLGTPENVIGHVANAYRLVFHGQTSLFDAIHQIKDQVPDGKEVGIIVKFLEETKGIIMQN